MKYSWEAAEDVTVTGRLRARVNEDNAPEGGRRTGGTNMLAETGRQRELSGCSVCLGDACSGWMIVWRWSPGTRHKGLMEKE